MSTPVDLLLTVMSAVHSRDIEAYKRACAWDKKWADEDLRQLLDLWSEDFFEYDILRAPLPPEDPEEGMIWPIYARHPRTGKWDDTIVPAFWKGKWQWTGNLGRPRDWRPFIPRKKRELEREGK